MLLIRLFWRNAEIVVLRDVRVMLFSCAPCWPTWLSEWNRIHDQLSRNMQATMLPSQMIFDRRAAWSPVVVANRDGQPSLPIVVVNRGRNDNE